MTNVSKAIVAVWGESKSFPCNTGHYVGIVEMVDYGFMRVEIILPAGVKLFPTVPCMVTVDANECSVEQRVKGYPIVVIDHWYSFNHMYELT